MRRIGLILITLMSIVSAVYAQDDGQLCVRSFEDRNGNGNLDPGEPVLTRGVGVNLLDTGGVTIASALLDQSPTAAQGVVCFQFLAAGQYSVVITSADYNTPDPVITTVATGGLPTVIEFAGQRADVEAAPTQTAAEPTLPDDSSVRVLVSALVTLLVVLGMIFLGVIVYFVAFRTTRRERTPVILDPRRTTGSMPAVTTRDTSETPKV